MQRTWKLTDLNGDEISWTISANDDLLSLEGFGTARDIRIVQASPQDDWCYKFQKTQMKTSNVSGFVDFLTHDVFRHSAFSAMKKQLLGI